MNLITVAAVREKVKAVQFTDFSAYTLSAVEVLTGGHAKWYGKEFGMIFTVNKTTRTIYPTEWVVNHGEGLIMVYKNHEFHALFTLAEVESA